MNEMIERCAKAVLKVESPDRDFVSLNEHGKLYYCDIARAVLKEIREPTAGMIIDGTQSYPGYKISIAAVERCWHAMIDVIICDQ